MSSYTGGPHDYHTRATLASVADHVPRTALPSRRATVPHGDQGLREFYNASPCIEERLLRGATVIERFDDIRARQERTESVEALIACEGILVPSTRYDRVKTATHPQGELGEQLIGALCQRRDAREVVVKRTKHPHNPFLDECECGCRDVLMTGYTHHHHSWFRLANPQ
jgi:hypothetical protein